MAQQTDIPRWARELGEDTWERLNDLLYDGWDTSDVMRELSIPQGKRRSLEIHARKYGPRRRLVRFAAFKDALLTGAVDLGPKFTQALGLIAANAVSANVKPSTQARACELMNTFARTLARMMVVDELADMLANVGSKGWGAFSENVNLQLLESSQRGTSPHKEFIAFCARETSILWLGGHLTTDTTGATGTYAAAAVQDEVRDDLRDDDIKREGRTIRRQIIAPMCAFAFQRDVPLPTSGGSSRKSSTGSRRRTCSTRRRWRG